MQIALYRKVYDLRIFQVKLDGVKREIIKNVENSSKKRPAARLEFLQKLFAQPTFGSTFITCTNLPLLHSSVAVTTLTNVARSTK